MKRPALWMAVLLAMGVAVGESRALSALASTGLFVQVLFSAALFILLAGLALYWRNHIAAALGMGFLAWILLGVPSVTVERISVSPRLVTTLAAQGHLDLSAPHRWLDGCMMIPSASPEERACKLTSNRWNRPARQQPAGCPFAVVFD